MDDVDKTNNDGNDAFYANHIYYHTAEDREKGLQYLNLWKYFFTNNPYESKEIIKESLLDRPDIWGSGIGSLALKLQIKENNED